MKDDFSWLDDERPLERSPASSGARRGLRRFLPRLSRLPRLRRRLRARADKASAPDSAAAILEGRSDRPVEELDNRLRALRERSFGEQPSGAEAPGALFDVDEVLVTPEFQRKPGGVISAVALSKAQERQVELLKDIVGGSLDASDEGDGGRPRLSPRFSLSAFIRLALSALLVLVVALPFVSSDYAVGDLTASEERPALTSMYDLLDDLEKAEHVLVALEYGPTAAGELDALTELLLRHIVAHSAKPIIVSGNPIALVHAQNIIRKINRSVAAFALDLEANQDYYLLRYLPGEALGLRELSENFADVARVSAKGELTGLEVSALEDMSLILLIAESAEDMRLWAEQVLPETEDARLLVATGYSAEPLAAAYADSLDEVVGLVVGFRDAYIYGEKLAIAYGAPSQSQRESTVDSAPAGESPDPQGAAQLPTVTAQSTPTSLPTATAPPTLRPSPTLPLPTATPPPTATPLPTATSEPVLYVEVTADQFINIRREPTTAADILALASEGDRFETLGKNDDGSWYNILLPDGVEAWIASFLVEELWIAAGDDSASASAPRQQTLMRLEFPLRLGKNQPRFYQAQASGAGDHPEFVLNRDRKGETSRLEAMTLGALASVLIIVFGNLVSALRAFGMRRSAGPAK